MVAMETYVMLFWSMHFLQDTYYMSNQCVYKFWDKSVHTLMNLEKQYVVHHGDLIRRSGTIWNQPEVYTSSGSKCMAQIVVSMLLETLILTFDLCSMLCHTH